MIRLVLIAITLLIPLKQQAQDLSEIYQKVSPGVVMIYTEEKSLEAQDGFIRQTTASGLGSGFMISDKHIITAAHVVNVPERIMVEFTDGQTIPARVVMSQKRADVAMIELVTPKKNATVLTLADSDQVKIGNQVFIIGAPYGLGQSLSVGYVSGFKKNTTGSNPFWLSEYIQTDAAINTGNSGGPMFNMDGEVIGIVSHITTETGGFQGIGFAATSNIASFLMLENKTPWSGADVVVLTGDLAREFDLPQASGLLVQRVVFSSPLGRKGIEGGDTLEMIGGQQLITGGDIILKINDITFDVTDEALNELAIFVQNNLEGSNFDLTILRDGQVKVIGKRD